MINHVRVANVEEGVTRVKTALVIYSYIAAYIKVQYRVIGEHPTGLTIARGVGRYPHVHTSTCYISFRKKITVIFKLSALVLCLGLEEDPGRVQNMYKGMYPTTLT
jgi:hypothetical protein